MEAIKISVEVSVNLSENTQSFIKSLICGSQQSVTSITTASPVLNKSTVSATPQKLKKSATTDATPVQTKSTAIPVPSAPVAPAASSASKTIEDVRKMLGQKVNEHRDVIKQKLNEFGAPSVTKLDPSKYDEMYNFLSNL